MARTRDIDYWLGEYARDHEHASNQLIHAICVPVIVVSLVGLLWSLPSPDEFAAISPALNWATAFLLAAVVYYFIMSIPLALGTLPLVLATVLIVDWADRLPGPLWLLSLVVFAAAWAAQVYGHHVEGNRPALMRNLQFIMIGPLWLLAKVFRRLGIPY